MTQEQGSYGFIGLVWEARHLARQRPGQPEADLLRQLATALEQAMFRDQTMRRDLEKAHHDAVSWKVKAEAAETLANGLLGDTPESPGLHEEAASEEQHLRSIGLDRAANVVSRLSDLNRSLLAQAASSTETAVSSMFQRDLFRASLSAEVVPSRIAHDRLERVRELMESGLKLSKNVDPHHLDAVLQATDPRASLESIIEFQRKFDEAEGL